MHDERFYAERALTAGACGYITKQADGETIVEAARRSLSGEVCVSSEMSQQILQTFANGKNPSGTPSTRSLSDREFEVFRLIGQGLSSGQIARRLHLSIKTVRTHRANIKGKLKIKSNEQMISYAASWLVHEGLGKAS